MRGRGSSRGLIAALSLTMLACSVPTGQAFSQDNYTMHDFKKLSGDDRLKICFVLGQRIWGTVQVREMVWRSGEMCKCLSAFVDTNPNEKAEKAAGLYTTAALCAQAR